MIRPQSVTPLNAGGPATSEHFRFLLDMSSRGVVAFGKIFPESAYTLTSTTAAQKLFNWSPNGAARIGKGQYLFRSQLFITGMSATSGNAQLLLGGTATIEGGIAQVWGADQASGEAVTTISGSGTLGIVGQVNAVTPSVGTEFFASWQGHFAVTAAGTVIPQIALRTAAAASVAPRSWFLIERVGDARVYGDWI